MKKLFVFLAFTIALSFIALQSHAQIVTTVTPSKATVTGTDTATATFGSESTVKSFECKVTRSAGYIRGKVYLVGVHLDGTATTNLDSMSITNTASAQTKMFIMTSLGYRQYKLQFLSDTTGSFLPKAYQLRR